MVVLILALVIVLVFWCCQRNARACLRNGIQPFPVALYCPYVELYPRGAFESVIEHGTQITHLPVVGQSVGMCGACFRKLVVNRLQTDKSSAKQSEDERLAVERGQKLQHKPL